MPDHTTTIGETTDPDEDIEECPYGHAPIPRIQCPHCSMYAVYGVSRGP